VVVVVVVVVVEVVVVVVVVVVEVVVVVVVVVVEVVAVVVVVIVVVVVVVVVVVAVRLIGKIHKFTLQPTTKPKRKQMYSSTLSSTSSLDEVSGQRHAPATLPSGKEARYPLYRRLGGPQGRSTRVRNISPPTKGRSPDRAARSESLH
jgi:hypothetical protein